MAILNSERKQDEELSYGRRPAWEERTAFLRKARKAFDSSSLTTFVVFAIHRILTRFDAFCGSTTTFFIFPIAPFRANDFGSDLMAKLRSS